MTGCPGVVVAWRLEGNGARKAAKPPRELRLCVFASLREVSAVTRELEERIAANVIQLLEAE